MIDLNSKAGRKVKRYLKNEKVIWLTTVGSDLTPQPRPVWFIRDDNSFLIFSQPHAHKIRHLAAQPKVALHFNTDETGDETVIIFVGNFTSSQQQLEQIITFPKTLNSPIHADPKWLPTSK